jgi:hypothetical protein
MTRRAYRTFQEGLLSKRLLVFTDYQMSFYCSVSAWTEGFRHTDIDAAAQLSRAPTRAHLFDRCAVRLTVAKWSWMEFADMLRMYSERQISKVADTLDAFVGVMNHIRQFHPDARIFQGLPFLRLMESFESLIAAALCWDSGYELNAPERQHMFPSWTWAGWTGTADFSNSSFGNGLRGLPLLRHVRMESSSGYIVGSSASHGINAPDQDKLDTVTLIQFEAPAIPAASFVSIAKGVGAGGRPIRRVCLPKNHTLDQLFENVQAGIWSCLPLSLEKWNGVSS